MVARPSGSAACQHAALPDRHGSVRRRASSQSQTASAWPRRSTNAGEIRPSVQQRTEEDFRDAEAIILAIVAVALAIWFAFGGEIRRERRGPATLYGYVIRRNGTAGCFS